MLKEAKIENYSGVNISCFIPRLRKGYWHELKGISVGGDAPKNFICIYEYMQNSMVRRNNPDTWPKYIAKVGHKWYPLESINEYLFNQIGEELGLNMASSRLIMVGNQLRFLSRYFLSKNESLEHGAQIFAGYLNDPDFVENIEREGLARMFFLFEFADKAIRHMFPREQDILIEDFVRMLVFDAIIGNNDRHFYNWGVVKDIKSKKPAIFAPIYDSARGLFWNDSEEKLVKWKSDAKSIDEKIKKYAEGSKPKIGWEGLENLNHFQLIEKIYSINNRYKEMCLQLINKENFDKTLKIIDKNFTGFYSPWRLYLIKKCIAYRFERLFKITEV